MHSFTIISTIFAAASFAAPAANADVSIARAPRPAISDVADHAKSAIDAKINDGCEVLKCVAALAPASITCATALAEAEINVLMDAACFAAALNNIANPPEACTSCAD